MSCSFYSYRSHQLKDVNLVYDLFPYFAYLFVRSFVSATKNDVAIIELVHAQNNFRDRCSPTL